VDKILVVVLAVSLLLAGPAWAAVTVPVTQVTAPASGVDSLASSSTIAVNAGDLIVVCSGVFNALGSSVTVTDDVNGGSYTQAFQVAPDASSLAQIHYRENSAASAALTVTVNPTGAVASIGFSIAVVRAAATASALDSQNTATGAVGLFESTATITTPTLAQADEVIFACMTHTAGTRGLTSDAAFTLLGENENNSTFQAYLGEYDIVAATTAVTATVVIAADGLTTGTWGIGFAAFKGTTATAGYILTEAGDCINAENSDRLITEAGAGIGPCVAVAATTPQRTLIGVGQ
jgi:hypothetical protein